MTLSTITVIAHEVDKGSFEIFDETNNVFNPFSVGDIFNDIEDRKAEMVQWAKDSGAFESALNNAIEYYRTILETGIGEGYEIIIHTK